MNPWRRRTNCDTCMLELGCNKNRVHKTYSTQNNYESLANQIKHWKWIWSDLQHVWSIKDINNQVFGIPNETLMAALSTAKIWTTKRGGDQKHKTNIGSEWFRSSSSSVLCLKFSSDREKRKHVVYDVYITSYSVMVN